MLLQKMLALFYQDMRAHSEAEQKIYVRTRQKSLATPSDLIS